MFFHLLTATDETTQKKNKKQKNKSDSPRSSMNKDIGCYRLNNE